MLSSLFRIVRKSPCTFSQLLNCIIAEMRLHAVGNQRDLEAEVAIPLLTDKESNFGSGSRNVG